MEIIFLGTGTSHGIPVAGCGCPVCLSNDPKNQRYRSSVLYKEKRVSLLIDISPEFRLQAVNAKMSRPDAVLITHAHNDHIGGLDDIRIFSKDIPVPIYASQEVCSEIKQRFPYIFNPVQIGGGVPNLLFNNVKTGIEFELGPFRIRPLKVWHGKLAINGFKINNTAYITDASEIPEATLKELENLDVLIINALRDRPHSTHQTVEQALTTIKRLRPKRSLLTHICHDLDHSTLNERLPEGTEAAFDGLTVVSG